jgi:hypothetical protein
VLPARIFTGLDTPDRQALLDWLDGADGVDAVIDLTVRGWNIAGAHVILGVFKPGEDQASWLIVGDGSGWMLARCADGFISEVSDSLPGILGLIDEQRQG